MYLLLVRYIFATPLTLYEPYPLNVPVNFRLPSTLIISSNFWVEVYRNHTETIIYFDSFGKRAEALVREKEIKKRESRTMIEKLMGG